MIKLTAERTAREAKLSRELRLSFQRSRTLDQSTEGSVQVQTATALPQRDLETVFLVESFSYNCSILP